MKHAIDLDALTLKTAQKTTEVPALQRTVAEMGELVCRMYIGKHIPDFNLQETEVRMDTPVSLAAVYKTPLGKVAVCRFLFFDFDPVIVEGGLVIQSADEKGWIFTCSSGFLTQNYGTIMKLITAAAERKVQNGK